MNNFYNREIETALGIEIKEIQYKKLKDLLNKVYKKNSFYRGKFDEQGVSPGDIECIADLKKLPFTETKEFQEDQQKTVYGTNLSEPLQNYVHLRQKIDPGQPLNWLDTHESWEWRGGCVAHALRAAGIDERDVLFLPFAVDSFGTLSGAYRAAQQIGVLTIPNVEWTIEQQIDKLMVNQATVLVITPNYAMQMLRKSQDLEINLAKSRVRAIILAGEVSRILAEEKEQLRNSWQALIYEYFELIEAGVYAYQCSENRTHLMESEFIAEIINHENGKETPSKGMGELVLTNLGRSCSPAIRLRTGISVKLGNGPCDCGRTFQILEKSTSFDSNF
ncbi:MAG: hypothetical protein KGZ96_00265 [Clostridia bacterium]|jgi:phenylacetate-CoA ligase|nr:hypothetical protein [Clostridia bacterium]